MNTRISETWNNDAGGINDAGGPNRPAYASYLSFLSHGTQLVRTSSELSSN